MSLKKNVLFLKKELQAITQSTTPIRKPAVKVISIHFPQILLCEISQILLWMKQVMRNFSKTLKPEL